MSLAAGRVFAGYTVVRPLGTGGGDGGDGGDEVYLAKHPRLPRQDALRVLPAELSADAEFRARFDRDADLAATLWHPNLPRVHDHGDHLGRLWIATEFVDGVDAARVVRDDYPTGMPAAEVVDVVTAVAAALDYARGHHLPAGHVTPAGILLTPMPERRILLTQFGIPRRPEVPDDRTEVNFAVGVQPIRDRDDQFALAATAHHLLSGAPRFAYPLGHGRPDLAAFDPALTRASAADPSARFDTCLDFARALRGGLAGQASTVAAPILSVDVPTSRSPVASLAPARFDGPATGPREPVFVPAWSEEPPPNPYLAPYPEDPYPDPDPAHSPTMTAMPAAAAPPPAPSDPDRSVDHQPGPTGRTWAIAAIAAVVVVVIALVVLVARGEGDQQARPTIRPQVSPAEQQPPAPGPSPLPRDGTSRQRVAPPVVPGPDGVGETCLDGYQITGRDDWASHAVRGNPAATCTFVGNVLKAYWDAADPSEGLRTVVAAGAIPCADGAQCSGDAFVVACAVEGADAWVTCRGGRDAVVYLY